MAGFRSLARQVRDPRLLAAQQRSSLRRCVEHFAPYTATVDKIKLTTEPAKNAQEVYATLDPVVQAVLTKKDADIPSLLASAKSTIESQLTR